MPNSSDSSHPYHIPPTYFSSSTANANSNNAHPGPSFSRRRSSLQQGGDARGSLTESDKFRDAEEEDVRHSGDYDMGQDLLAFNPPPPRGGPDSLSSPYQRLSARPSDQNMSSTALSPLSNGMGSSGSTATSPGRERMPSSNSITSMSSNTGGRRAPAPAALELSPRKERQSTRNPYGDLGYGAPSSETRRVTTEPMMDRVSNRQY
jgi:hypothetical protein